MSNVTNRWVLWKKFWWHYVSRYKKLIIACIVFVLIHVSTGAFNPYFMRNTIDAITQKAWNTLKFWLIVWFISGGINIIALFFRYYSIQRININVYNDIALDMYRKCHTTPYSKISQMSTGYIMQRFSDDLPKMTPLIMDMLTNVVGNSVFLILMFVIMFKISVLLSSIAAAFFILSIVGYQVYKRIIPQVTNMRQQALAYYLKELEEGLNVTYTIRIHGALNRALKRFGSALGEYLRKFFAFEMLQAKYQGIFTNGLLFASQITIIGIGAVFALKGILTIGTLMAFMTYTRYLYFVTSFITTFAVTVEPSLVSLKRVMEVLSWREEYVIEKIKKPQLNKKHPYIIEVKNLNFRFNDIIVFESLNLAIKKNSITAILAKSGYGKTTLFNLWFKLYPVPDNTIFIDGRDINKIELDEIVGIFTCIEQEPKFVTDSVWENLKLISPSIDTEKVKELLRIMRLENFFDYISSKHTASKLNDLSGGEKKRLAILRGLLRDTPVVIMDEPTAFLDRRTAKKILSNLVEFLKNNGKTVIIATHDPLAVSVCEDIIKLEEIARRAS